jgi:hypothetical protein
MVDPQESVAGSGGNNNTAAALSGLGNPQAAVLFAVVLAVCLLAQHAFAEYTGFRRLPVPAGVRAALAGAIVALVVYLPLAFLLRGLTRSQVADLAVLIGVIVAYSMVFEMHPGVPSFATVALMVFLFYFHAANYSSAAH